MGEVRDYDYGYVSLDEVEEVVRDAPREADNIYFFFSSRRRHTRFDCDWSSERVLFRSRHLQGQAGVPARRARADDPGAEMQPVPRAVYDAGRSGVRSALSAAYREGG